MTWPARTFVAVERFLKRTKWAWIGLAILWAVFTYQSAKLSYVLERLAHLKAVATVAAIGEVFFIGGLIMLAFALGQHIFAGTSLFELVFAGGVGLVLAAAAVLVARGWRPILLGWVQALVLEVILVGVGLGLMAASCLLYIRSDRQRLPWQWAKTIMALRADRQALLHHARTSRLFQWGFTANWIGALLGITGVPLLVAILWVLPPAGWGLIIIPIADILVSCSLRVVLRPRSPSQGEVQPS